MHLVAPLENLPQMHHLSGIDNSTPSKKWMKLVDPLTQKQAATLMQLRSGHIALNKHLHQIQHSASPICPNCDEDAIESVQHFLLTCTGYQQEHFVFHQKLQHWSLNISYLLSNPKATIPLLKYIHTTGTHLKILTMSTTHKNSPSHITWHRRPKPIPLSHLSTSSFPLAYHTPYSLIVPNSYWLHSHPLARTQWVTAYRPHMAGPCCIHHHYSIPKPLYLLYSGF